MFEYIVKRLLLATFTLLAILLVSYVLLRLAPGDPTKSNIFGSDAAPSSLDASKGALRRSNVLREKLNLDKPIIVGFALWLKALVLHGDFGVSASVDPGKPVTTMILERLPITLSLNFWAIIITYLCAIPLGVYAAVHAGGHFDRGSAFVLFLLYSLPVMWVALLLQTTLCEGGKWPIFPLKGLSVANADSLSTWQLQWELLRCYTLPVLCLTYANFAGLSRYARNGMLEVIHSDYIRTARAKGVSETGVIWRHGFRNGLITLITLFGGLLPSLVAGSLLVEYIFNIPGMGTLSLLALSSRDYPLQMALFAFTGMLTLGGIFVSDMLYLAADPRIKLQS
ncbi:MAG: ABC transporter permease [Victivallales bacterium]|jgi:peptide/nickel transport system permease protein|nr:ABC transporter permease [Victivallales bacterium]